MGLLHKRLSIIYFDDMFYEQRKLQTYHHEKIDLRKFEHVNLFCEQDSMNALQDQLQKRRNKGITLIGSGNYHYITYLLLNEIKKPFTLVLYDNHTDLGMYSDDQNESLLSCGSWVSHALKHNQFLQQVVIIGPTAVKMQNSTNPRVVIFPIDEHHHYSPKSILSAIHTQNVYISVDKDVLNPACAVTNWDQGIMDIDTLTMHLKSILLHKQVEGIDICGEAPISPLNAFLPDSQASIKINEKSNLKILQTCFQMSHEQIRWA